MFKVILALVALFIGNASQAAIKFNHRPTNRAVQADLESGDTQVMANRIDYSMNSIVKFAVWKLKDRGNKAQAEKIDSEWENKFKGLLTRYTYAKSIGAEDKLGDYKPLSEWLSEIYKILVLALGEQTVKFFHLDDIQIFNHGIPVVFAMHKVLGPVNIDSKEYKLHFVPLASVTSYWSVWIGCQVVTYGGGWTLICMPAGTAAEYAMEKFIAPKFSDTAYDLFWVE